MDITRTGKLVDKFATAQGVELLLEHQSIPSKEFHARMAFALMKEVRFKNKIPLKLSLLSLFPCPSGTRTVLTTCDASMLPSFFNSFAGLSVPLQTPVLKSDSRAPSPRKTINAASPVGSVFPAAISARG